MWGAEVFFVQVVLLNHRSHCAIENEDAELEEVGDFGHGVGSKSGLFSFRISKSLGMSEV
jgi:hypothetical protein